MKTKYIFLIVNHNVTSNLSSSLTAWLIKIVGSICYPLPTPFLSLRLQGFFSRPRQPPNCKIQWAVFSCYFVYVLCGVWHSRRKKPWRISVLHLQSVLPTTFFMEFSILRCQWSNYLDFSLFSSFNFCFICSLWYSSHYLKLTNCNAVVEVVKIWHLWALVKWELTWKMQLMHIKGPAKYLPWSRDSLNGSILYYYC